MDHVSRALYHRKSVFLSVVAVYLLIFWKSSLKILPWPVLHLLIGIASICALLLPPPLFRHSPLQDASKSIRLLRYSGPLAFELIEKSFEEIEKSRIEYSALSYTWEGDFYRPLREPPYGLVTVDSRKFEVKRNLYSFFLFQQYKLLEDSLLYVDAICIDQTNLEEKASQVQIMQDVYKHAARVVVYLEEGPSQNLEVVREALSVNENTRTSVPMDQIDRLIWEVMTKEYWERLWIVQEVLLGGNVGICNKDSGSISWSEFAHCLRRFKNASVDQYKELANRYPHATTVIEAKARWDEDRFNSQIPLGFTIWEALETFSRQKCENKRDKIYALFGILRDRSIRVSYEEKESWTNLHLFQEVLNHGVQEIPRQSDCRAFHDFLLRYFTDAEMLSGAQQERAARIPLRSLSTLPYTREDAPFYNARS